MNEEKLTQELRLKLREDGYESRTVSAEHVPDLREGIEGSRVRGLLNTELYQEYLSGFSFKPTDVLSDARSLVVVAVPQPQVRVVFTHEGQPRSVIIPPTYAHGTDKKVEDILSSVLNAAGYHAARAALPLKLLSVRSGLGEYGRNNICYVSGMGSFVRLAAFYTDLPCSEVSWREPRMLDRCQDCRACLNVCPTGAIASDRFMIRAERCITFRNERLAGFPSWIEPSWHNCIVGCLHCQRACPENRHLVKWLEGDHEFSEDETALILSSTPAKRLPSETAKKLERLDIIEYADVLGRNLAALLWRQEPSSPLDSQTNAPLLSSHNQ